MKYPRKQIKVEIPYDDYKKLVEKKGDKTWREVLYEWGGIEMEE